MLKDLYEIPVFDMLTREDLVSLLLNNYEAFTRIIELTATKRYKGRLDDISNKSIESLTDIMAAM